MLKVDSTPSLSEYLSYYPSHIVYRSLDKKPEPNIKFSDLLEKELDKLMSGNKIYTKCTYGRREDECQK